MEPSVEYVGPAGERLAGPAGAVAAEVQEYDDDGVPTTRTYAHLDVPPKVTLAQTVEEEDVADPDNADQGQVGWDLWAPGPAGDFDHRVSTVAELLHLLGAAQDPEPLQRAAVARQMELPAWRGAPDALKTEAYAWLEATRPKTAGT